MDMENTTRIVLAWELYEQGLTQERIAQQLGRHRETVGLWLKGIKAQGLEAFLTSYAQAKRASPEGAAPHAPSGRHYQAAGVGDPGA